AIGNRNVARSHAGADRNLNGLLSFAGTAVARSHAGADRNVPFEPGKAKPERRPFTRGRGSKLKQDFSSFRIKVSPVHTRARIETIAVCKSDKAIKVARSHAGADRNIVLAWAWVWPEC